MKAPNLSPAPESIYLVADAGSRAGVPPEKGRLTGPGWKVFRTMPPVDGGSSIFLVTFATVRLLSGPRYSARRVGKRSISRLKCESLAQAYPSSKEASQAMRRPIYTPCPGPSNSSCYKISSLSTQIASDFGFPAVGLR